MHYLFLTILTLALSSCSLWPWRAEKTGTCLDDDSCEATDPLTQELIGGIWYCYGAQRDLPWDCSQNEDSQKIIAVSDEQPTSDASERLEARQPAAGVNVLTTDSEIQDEITNAGKKITKQPNEGSASKDQNLTDHLTPSDIISNVRNNLTDYNDDSYAIQLIAVQSLGEANEFSANYSIDSSKIIKTRSKNSDWYVVILDVFENLEEAQLAAKDWQTLHRTQSITPWIRPMGPLKQSVSAE